MTSVPMLDGLRIDDIIYMARLHYEIDQYLPELNHRKKPSREFVWNIGEYTYKIFTIMVNTLIPDNLQQLINELMETREEKF